MTHSTNALILRAVPNRGRTWVISCFSEKFGRLSFSAFAKNGSGFCPFCLVETALSFNNSEFAVSQNIEIVDTFTAMRGHQGATKSAFLLRAIIEQCLPLHAPAEETWRLLLSLFETLPSFHDWKAAPLVLALTFFEQEGISPRAITELPTLSQESRQIAQELIESDEQRWKEASIPQQLFDAALEAIGVRTDAKGGT